MQDNKNILLATLLSMLVLVTWTLVVEKPRVENQEQQSLQNQQEELAVNSSPIQKKSEPIRQISDNNESDVVVMTKSRSEIITETKKERIKISSDNLHGSISLKGARFDDLTLAKYFETTKKEKEVVLFAPPKSEERYFADFGWISSNSNIDLPTPNTLWKSDSNILTPQKPIKLSWKNKQNIEFIIKIALDENYMFSIEQIVNNNSKKDISAAIYGRINRSISNLHKAFYILHEGAIGEFNKILQEITYSDLIENKAYNFESNGGGWLGITDKYWLSSILPDKNLKYDASFDYKSANKKNIFNSEFIGQEYKIAPKNSLKFSHHLFAGAKKVRLLDKYSKDYDVGLFDRTVDFGWFYFLTKPFFYIVSFLSGILGNFGLAILAMTVLVKAVLFPMANKSYAAIAKVKKLQPKIEELRKQYKDDKIALNRETMAMYKREKVNPAAGCLPMLIQIPIFFSLYKVLFVTIDMRHAPFYGWISDLSAADPTSIFNLFGLLPFEVSATFTIGVWPILMGLTMFIQQKLSPTSADPMQTKILRWMPLVLTFVLATFPAGLVIYWTWSNSLSILQQYIITKKLQK